MIIGHHHGQADHRIQLPGGYVEFSVFRGTAHISMIQSTKPGTGSALVRMVAAEVGGYNHVEWGWVTPAGAKLRNKMDKEFGYVPPQPIDLPAFVKRHHGRLLSQDGGAVYVEFASEEHLNTFLAEIPADAEPDIQESEGFYWVDVTLPTETPARLAR